LNRVNARRPVRARRTGPRVHLGPCRFPPHPAWLFHASLPHAPRVGPLGEVHRSRPARRQARMP